MTIEKTPGALLLDHLYDAGTQFKGYLRALRGTGLGVLFAADVEDVRDRQRFRSMHLAYREMEVPPLANRYLYRILADALAEKSLPDTVSEADRSALIKAARGRPGWTVMMAERLQNSDYWSCDHVHVASLWASIMIEVKKKYFVQAESPQKKSGGF